MRAAFIPIAMFLMIPLTGCYRAKSANTTLDLTEVPSSVAILVPLEGTSATFGTTQIGSSSDKTITVGNFGPYDASKFQNSSSGQDGSSPFGFKDGSFPGTGGTCPEKVTAKSTCTLVLSFSPTTEGESTGSLSMTYVNGVMEAPFKVDLNGVTPASVTLSGGSSHDFGSVAVGSSADVTITLTNGGTARASEIQETSGEALSPPFLFKDGAFPGTGGDCTGVLEPAASCTVILSYTPVSSGSFNSTLSISYRDGTDLTQKATQALTGSSP